MNLFKNNSQTNRNKITENVYDFLKSVSNLNQIFESNKKLQLKEKNTNEVLIEQAGNYSEYILTKQPLRNPYLEENKEFKGDYFGNPFRRESQGDTLKNKIDKPNINISDGESLMVNSNSKNVISIKSLKKLSKDDDLSVFPDEESTNAGTKSNDSSELIDLSIQANTDSEGTCNSELIKEFKDLFHQTDSERQGTKIENKFEFDIKNLYDWKLSQKIKDSIIFI